jgi:collagenase-like PrtC family protease
LNYRISLISNNPPKKEATPAVKAISAGFSLLSGADPCGACDLYRLKKVGINSVKIVGRNYSTSKKAKDVKFLKGVLLYLEQNPYITEEDFKSKVKTEYKNIYRMNCNNLCYRFS